MPVSDNDVVRGVLHGTSVDGDEVVNVFTWLVDKVSVGDFTDTEIGTIVTDAIEKVMTEILGIVASGYSFDTVDVYKRGTGVWDYITTVVPVLTAVGSGDVAPAGVAMLATAYTDLNRVFGRKFIYGITEGNMTSGKIWATALLDLADFADEYISSYNGAAMGALDYLRPGVWSSKTSAFEQFNGIAVVKDTLSYQRRRKKGVGV
jgi:hypothetical protein